MANVLIRTIVFEKAYTVPIILFIIAYLFYSFNLTGQPWHGDEVFFNAGGGVYFDLIRKGDLTNPCWNGFGECVLLHNFSWEWPVHSSHLRHFFIGLGQYLTGNAEKNYLIWSSWHHDFWKEEYTPTSDEFAAGRFFSPILGSLAVVATFCIGKLLFNRFIGIIFSLVLLFHPLWLWNSRIAMTEIYSGFFMITGFCLLFYFLKSNDKMRYLIPCAVLFGFAFNAKYTSLYLVPIVLFLIWFRGPLSERFRLKKGSIPKSILLCSLFVGMFFASIFATNPYFYPNPIGQFLELTNGSEEYTAITKPSLENDNLFRSLATFHSILVPYSVNYYDFNSAEEKQLHLNWDLPYTYSTIPITIFFFVSMAYLISRIKSNNLLLSEFAVLIWFFILFVEIAFTVKDIWVERFFIPLIFPVTLLASYGLWKFSVQISDQKYKIVFCTFFIICSAASVLFFYDYIYNSPGEYWSRLENTTIQSVISRPDSLALMFAFIAFFAFTLYRYVIQKRVSSKKKKITIMLVVLFVLITPFVSNSSSDIVAKSSYEKTVNVNREKIFDVMADVTSYHKVFPNKVVSVDIINKTNNVIYTKEIVQQSGIKVDLIIKHVLVPYESHKIEVVQGDAKGTVIDITYEDIGDKTKIFTTTNIHLQGILKPFGAALQLSLGVIDKVTNKILTQFENYAINNI